MVRPQPTATLSPYTTLFRSEPAAVPQFGFHGGFPGAPAPPLETAQPQRGACASRGAFRERPRSEEYTSELQSHVNLVCRLLLENKKKEVECDEFMAQFSTEF